MDPRSLRTFGLVGIITVAVACSSTPTTTTTSTLCTNPPAAPATGDLTGNLHPLASTATEARAGRIHAADLPVVPSGLITWKDNDFVIANDRVALVIEDVGNSDLYDPWGGRPVGLSRVVDGKMVDPNNFGEMFLLTGRSTIVTEDVSVINDGSDGNPAIIRASGKLHPLPFFESVIEFLFPDDFTDITAAIDYELAPGSEHVDVRFRYVSPRTSGTLLHTLLHAVMYTKRTPAFVPGQGFTEAASGAKYLSLIDDHATSWAYVPAPDANGPTTFTGLAVSGFVGAFTDGFTLPGCAAFDRIHGKIVIGGPGVDGLVAAAARTFGDTTRVVTGTLTRAGTPVAGAHVHAVDATSNPGTSSGGYYTRATTDESGAFSLTVPATAALRIDAYLRGDAVGSANVAANATTATIDLPDIGHVHVTVSDPGGTALPARVQILPSGSTVLPTVPDNYGEAPIVAGRLHVAYATSGDVTLPVPPGDWEVIVSRGYEYELYRQTVTVTAGATNEVDATLDHVVDTTGILCGDFHIHTNRSNDASDDGIDKVASAVADGLELPVRSDHEWVGDFSSEIAKLGVGAWAKGIASVELTSFQVWGHMGVFPLLPDANQVNGGAPKWQTFPTADSLDTAFTTMSPPDVFAAVRARPEQPVVIINHPRGTANYFDYVGFDPMTGIASDTADWDTHFTLVEVFNSSDWLYNRNRTVADWLALNHSGRHVVAVGSSDSHGLSYSPVGYPRTCVTLGTDDPSQATGPMVRDGMIAGHVTVSGGVYVTASITTGDGKVGPGDTASGLGPTASVDVIVQAPTWVDVQTIEVIVDGQTVDTISVLPSDADVNVPSTRWHGSVPINVSASAGYVVIAAYGSTPLDPVHPGYIPFGVTNPIYVAP